MFHDARFSPRVRKGYTQNLEEEFILKHSRGSRFLDIGAYDGETFSSTKALTERGWSGVYVEPNPCVLDNLKRIASACRSTVLPVAISNSCGKMPFYVNADMVSSLDKSHIEMWERNNNMVFETIDVDVIDVNELANRIGTDYDFLNLDVEGLNWDIFCQFDWSKWKFNTVCIEYDRKFIAIKYELEKAGFSIVYASPENIVATR